MGENLLKTFRTSRGLSQQALADLLGIARNYVYLIESGRKPMTESIRHRLDLLDGDVANCPGKLDGEANLVNQASNSLSVINAQVASLSARMDSLDARLATIEKLLLRLVADGGGKTGG